MDADELRLRRLAGQHLLSPVDKLTAAGDLCGAQAQFFGNAVHALTIRSAPAGGAPFGAGLVKT